MVDSDDACHAGLGLSSRPLAMPENLHLSHPTDDEKLATWRLTAANWKGALSASQYVEGKAYLSTVRGVTHWILVDKLLAPNRRPVLASCETLRKRALVADAQGNLTEPVVVYGIASVYCEPRYRGRGYASRMLRELSATLPTWQTDTEEEEEEEKEEGGEGGTQKPVAASVLYSGIGKQFYARLGWRPFSSYHVTLNPGAVGEDEDEDDVGAATATATPIYVHQVGELCEQDESISRRAMARPYPHDHDPDHDTGKTRFMVLPDHDHMRWHHRQEEFVCSRLFGKAKQPQVKGAIAGPPGNRVWAIWTHRFYADPRDEEASVSGNTLYILRLVVENLDLDLHLLLDDRKQQVTAEGEGEGEGDLPLPVGELKAVLKAARAEAAEWNLQHVVLWGPSAGVEELIRRTGIQHRREDREEDGVCSLQWYMQGAGDEESLDWIGNEKYAWC